MGCGSTGNSLVQAARESFNVSIKATAEANLAFVDVKGILINC
jgi:hypothetical protein